MKAIILMFFGLTLTGTVACAQFQRDYSPLLNSIQKTVEQAVGTKVADRLPGGLDYSDFGSVLRAEVIECPTNVTVVKQAADLLQARLSLDFTNRVAGVTLRSFPPADDVLLEAGVRDAKDPNMVLSVKVTIFKRSSSHVFIFPVYAGLVGGGGG
jgi:hypothetical protein